MTIPTTNTKITATGTGSTNVYPYTNIKIFDDDQLEVRVKLLSTLVETTLTKATDYTVTGVGLAAGGNVVLVDADQIWLDGSGYLLSTYSITIRRTMEFTQETSITSQSSNLPELHEKQFDRLAMADLQLKEIASRSLQLPITETGSAALTTLPDATTRANKAFIFDASGNPSSGTLTSVGAPLTAGYVTIASQGDLSAERVLTGTANQITVTDNGANSTVVLSIPAAAAIVAASVTDSGLTAGRVTIAGTAGLLEDDGGLLYDKATDILSVAGAVKVIPAAAPGVLANGQTWSDSTQIAPTHRTGGMTEYASRCIYSQITDVTVADTVTPTTLLAAPAFGTATIAANYLTVGKILKITAFGSFGITGTPTLTIDFLRAGTSIGGNTITTTTNAILWTWTGYMQCVTTGAGGTGDFGWSWIGSTTTGTGAHTACGVAVAQSLNTTGTIAIGLQVTWGTASASNTITCRSVFMEILG